MSKIYGSKPVDLGLIDLNPTEMMFWLYCPIKIPGNCVTNTPKNLKQFLPIIREAAYDASKIFKDSYVYITAKTLYVSADNPGNRPGWHSDGFMTDDLNYIWSNTNGTLFWEPPKFVEFTQDHSISLKEMQDIAEPDVEHHRVYKDKHLLRLDQGVIHRVANVNKPGMRTFVKISFSKEKYNLVGNSINHELQLDWDYFERSEERNDPAKGKS
jgi:hypothetical protein